MQYYMIEWEHEEADDPWRLFLEMDDKGSLLRKIEVFRIGVYEPYENLNTHRPTIQVCALPYTGTQELTVAAPIA